MKTFEVTLRMPATQVWKYTVEAITEEDAKELVESGEVDPDSYTVEESDYDGYSELSIEEVEQ